MGFLITAAVFLVTVFRWQLFQRFIGTKGMLVADTLGCTVLAAWLFAKPGSWPVVSYALAAICALVAFASARALLRLIESTNVDAE